jgi:hypothetical protein
MGIGAIGGKIVGRKNPPGVSTGSQGSLAQSLIDKIVASPEGQQHIAEQKRLTDQQAYNDMTPMDREVAKISAEQWNRYVEKFRPLENRVIWDVGNNERFAPVVQGAINANIQQKGGSWGERVASGGATSGALLGTGGAIKLSRSLAKGGVLGQQDLEREKGMMTQNLVTMGRGGGDIAASGLGTAARTATQTAISDWQYDQGLSDLDTRQRMNDSAISTARYVSSMGALSDLMSTGTGAAMWAANGGIKGWGGTSNNVAPGGGGDYS